MSPPPPTRGRRRRRTTPAGELYEWAHQAHVIGLARFYGFMAYHPPAGGTGTGREHRVDREQKGRGFPDLTLVRPPRLILAELKPTKGSPRVTIAEASRRPAWLAHRDIDREQAEWLEALAAVAAAGAGLEVYVWRPADLEDVARILHRDSGLDLAMGLSYARERMEPAPGGRPPAPHGAP